MGVDFQRGPFADCVNPKAKNVPPMGFKGSGRIEAGYDQPATHCQDGRCCAHDDAERGAGIAADQLGKEWRLRFVGVRLRSFSVPNA